MPLNLVYESRASQTPKKILLVGSGGYLGRHTLHLLTNSSDFEVTRWDRLRHGSFVDRDARERALDNLRPDFLVNLAWQATNTTNYEYSAAHPLWADSAGLALQECADRGIGCVLIGSGIDAEHLSSQDTDYSAAKKQLRQIFDIRPAASTAALLSPGYMFSLSDRRPRIMDSILSRRIASEADLRYPNLALDFIEVRDVASAVVTVLRSRLSGRLVPFSGVPRTVIAFYAVVCERMGLPTSAGTDQPIPYWPEEAESLLASGWWPTQTDFFFNNER